MTHESMVVKDEDGYVDAGAQDDHTFRAQQGLVYSVEEAPGEGLLRTDLAIETPHSHHVLANRLDVSKRGAGVHRLEVLPRRHTQIGLFTHLSVALLVGGLSAGFFCCSGMLQKAPPEWTWQWWHWKAVEHITYGPISLERRSGWQKRRS